MMPWCLGGGEVLWSPSKGGGLLFWEMRFLSQIPSSGQLSSHPDPGEVRVGHSLHWTSWGSGQPSHTLQRLHLIPEHVKVSLHPMPPAPRSGPLNEPSWDFIPGTQNLG